MSLKLKYKLKRYKTIRENDNFDYLCSRKYISNVIIAICNRRTPDNVYNIEWTKFHNIVI